jgi:hypothetical protein
VKGKSWPWRGRKRKNRLHLALVRVSRLRGSTIWLHSSSTQTSKARPSMRGRVVLQHVTPTTAAFFSSCLRRFSAPAFICIPHPSPLQPTHARPLLGAASPPSRPASWARASDCASGLRLCWTVTTTLVVSAAYCLPCSQNERGLANEYKRAPSPSYSSNQPDLVANGRQRSFLHTQQMLPSYIIFM